MVPIGTLSKGRALPTKMGASPEEMTWLIIEQEDVKAIGSYLNLQDRVCTLLSTLKQRPKKEPYVLFCSPLFNILMTVIFKHPVICRTKLAGKQSGLLPDKVTHCMEDVTHFTILNIQQRCRGPMSIHKPHLSLIRVSAKSMEDNWKKNQAWKKPTKSMLYHIQCIPASYLTRQIRALRYGSYSMVWIVPNLITPEQAPLNSDCDFDTKRLYNV